MAISSLTKNLLSLFLKKTCPVCGFSSDDGGQLCNWCKLRMDTCSTVHRTTDSGIPVYSALMYRGLPGEIVQRMKYSGEKYLATIAAELISHYSMKLPVIDDVLIPIPAGRRRKRERGYNQAALISKKLASISGCRHLDILVKDDSPSQVGLSSSRRRENVYGIFHLKDRCSVPERVDIWLVDDVATTCSTIDSAGGVLLDSGARSVTGLTLTYRKKRADSIIHR